MSDKILVIAEKPSAAGDIARAIGKLTRGKDCYEGERYIVSSAVGHLLEIVPPEGVEVKRGKWSLTNLPVLPDSFDLRPITTSEDRLKTLTKLYNRKDVGEVINACDAGREGELIFYNLIRYLTRSKKTNKPLRRLWLQSMTPAAIRRGFDSLRDNTEMVSLQHAALSRAEADWLIGINGTRAMTALHSAGGGFFLTTVGRVQTPTLALIVERERQITAFISQPYWEVRAQFQAAAGLYEGLWNNTSDAQAKKPERIFAREKAEEILAACTAGKEGIVTEKVKPVSELSPPLFDLTSLQRDANARFGFSAKMTLSTAQSLYERHKLITYPRTDSRALPEDYPATVKKTLTSLADVPDIGEFARQVLDKNWVVGANKRIFNNAKISDHFAIIPTGEAMRDSLRDTELKLYDLITRRFLAVFFPAARFSATERKTDVGGHIFVTKGKVMQEAGWRAVATQTVKDTELVAIKDGESVSVQEIESEEKATTPPPRYNEATLLSAMESAGKLVDDEELREAMRERGLGTPATRATIIEGLLRENYLTRDRRDLLPTPKAHSLVRLLSALKVDVLTKPALTGEWEYKLRQIETDGNDHRIFMDDIRKLTQSIVDAARECGDVESIPGDFAVLTAPCPGCGGKVHESHRRFSCGSCEFFVWKAIAGREFSVAEMENLLKDGESGELSGFRSKMGKEFSANVRLQKGEGEGDMLRATFDFGNEESAEALTPEQIAEKDAIAPCPKCQATVRDIGGRYMCEKAALQPSPTCDFSIAKRILQQELVVEQIRLLLTEGKTAELPAFVSKKTGRPFKARLTMDLSDATGKLGFEFAPRPAKKAAKKSTRSTRST